MTDEQIAEKVKESWKSEWVMNKNNAGKDWEWLEGYYPNIGPFIKEALAQVRREQATPDKSAENNRLKAENYKLLHELADIRTITLRLGDESFYEQWLKDTVEDPYMIKECLIAGLNLKSIKLKAAEEVVEAVKEYVAHSLEEYPKNDLREQWLRGALKKYDELK